MQGGKVGSDFFSWVGDRQKQSLQRRHQFRETLIRKFLKYIVELNMRPYSPILHNRQYVQAVEYYTVGTVCMRSKDK
jgi:hypothetical protein